MKKSLTIISFAFIFLLTLSVVSAGLWITGDVQQKAGSTTVRKTTTAPDTSEAGTAFSRSTEVQKITQSTRKNSEFQCPRGGWKKVAAKESGFCCVKTEGKSKRFLGLVIAE